MTSEPDALAEPVPEVLTEPSEVLNRQVHPSQVDDVRGVSKAAFAPTTRDRGMLSTLRGHVGPDEAFRRHVEENGLKSAGTWGVSVGEATTAAVPVICDDCLPDMPPDHASIDFTPHPERPLSKRLRVADQLRRAAVDRGPLFRP